MPWTHFTAPLAEGQMLTRAMRAELLAALDERLKAVDPSWGVQQAGEAGEDALAASGLATRRLYYRGPASTSTYSLSDWHTVLGGLASSFYVKDTLGNRPVFARTLWSQSTLLMRALEESSITSTDWSTYVATPLDTRAYWSMIREAIRLLTWRPLLLSQAAGASARRVKAVIPADYESPGPTNLTNAIAAYAAAGESISGSGGPLAFSFLFGTRSSAADTTPRYLLSQGRSDQTINLPTQSVWSEWAAAVQASWGAVDAPFVGRPDLALSLGGSDIALASPTATGVGQWEGPFAGLSATGAVSLVAEFPDYSSGAEFTGIASAAPWGPGFAGEEHGATARLGSINLAGSPAWVFP
jgi:hypothetical protein